MVRSAAARAKEVNGKSNGLHSPVAFFNNAVAVRDKSREGGWMKKVIEGAEQKRQLSISTIGLIVAIALALWQVGGGVVTAIRGDTKQEMEIQRLSDTLKIVTETQTKTNEKIESMQTQLNEVLSDKKVQDAKVQGYKLGQSDGDKGHK